DGFYGRGAPCADGAGDHGDDMEEIEGAALEVLAGDVLESLPAGPEIDAVADLGVAGDGADGGIFKVGNELGDGVGSDDGVGVDADVDLLRDAIEGVVEGGGLAFIVLGEHLQAAGSDVLCVSGGGHFSGAVAGAVVDDDDAEVFVVGVEHGADGADDNGFFVIRGDENGDAGTKAGRGLAVRTAQAVDEGEDADDDETRAHEHVAKKENHKNKIADDIDRGKSDGVRKCAQALPESERG